MQVVWNRVMALCPVLGSGPFAFSPFLRPCGGMPRGQKLNHVFKGVPWPLRGRDLAAVVAARAISPKQQLESRSGPLCSEGPAVAEGSAPVGCVLAAAVAKGKAASVRPAMASAKGPIVGQRPMAASAKGTAIGTRSFLLSEGFAIPRVPEPRRGQGCGNAVAGVASSSADKRHKVIKILSTKRGRDEATEALERGMHTESTKAVKESRLATLMRYAAVAEVELFPLTPEVLSPILGAMKLAGYKSTVTYLMEARVRHTQLHHSIPESLRLYFRDAARSVVRDRGPVRRAAVVRFEDLEELDLQTDWATQECIKAGPCEPWSAFVVATWWLLRGAELISLKLGQCKIDERGQLRGEIHLGATKMDIEGKGKRRCFACICGKRVGDTVLCPACALGGLLRRRREQGAGDQDFLLVSPCGDAVSHVGLSTVWKEMLKDAQKKDDRDEQSLHDVSEHTPRRAGAQFHARRGLQLWQIQYIGRWGGGAGSPDKR